MDQTPLVNDLIDAGARFLEEFDKRYPVAVAFWLKDKDERRWYLHIASPKIADGTRDAYGDVLRITAQMKDPSFDPFNVKLRMMADPIVQFAANFQRPYAGRAAMIYDVPAYHGTEVEGMYLYPPVQAAAA